MFHLVVIAVLAGSALAAPKSNPFIHVDPTLSPGQFVGGDNRARIFHGVAAVYKTPPYYPILDHFDAAMSLTTEDMDNLVEWGFTAVRLFAAWPGVYPARGQVNVTYLTVLEGIVNQLGARGIYTILDAHQDVWSPRFCGEGAPDWAVLPFLNESSGGFPYPLGPPYNISPTTGAPSRADCLTHGFAEYYFSSAVSVAFQDLYDNRHGLADAFAAHWAAVAQHFSTNPYVLGYELLNEPWPGDVWADPALLLPHYADNTSLAPLYSSLHSTIRAVDDAHTILFEPVVGFTALPFGNLTTSGFTQGPGGPAYNDRQAFSYHIYCALNSTGQPSLPLVCSLYEDILFQMRMQDLANIGVAGFLTEFGAYSSGSGDDLTDADHLLGLADANLQSWAYWMFKGYGDPTTSAVDANGYVFEGLYNENTSQLLTDKVRMLARPYAPVVGGRYTSMLFNTTSQVLTVTYTALTSAVTSGGVNTEVYTSQSIYYPTGYTLVVSPASAAASIVKDDSHNRVYITHSASVKDGDAITITVSPS